MTSLVGHLRGEAEIDQWGCDPDVQDALNFVLRQIVRVEVTGAFPPAGPALVVANRRFGVLEPVAVGQAVRATAGRRMRFVGLPDIAPLGTLLRRAGVAVNRPAEMRSLFRAGHIVGLPLAVRPRRPLRASQVSPDDVEPAFALGVPVIPVAVVGGEMSGRWRVFVGDPIAHPRARGPLGLAELADGARHGVQALLDEATPPRWLVP